MGLTIDETLELVPESPTRFRSARLEHPLNWEVLFGGFVVGQSLWAATQTVDDAFDARSLQGVYGDIDLNAWHLTRMHGIARGVVRGQYFTREDKLIAVSSQEVLQRSEPGPLAYKL